MYHLAIRQFAFTLRNLDAIMGKAQQFALARKFDVNNFCGARMFPDMLPFLSQIRLACDHAKNTAAALSGKQPPVHEDNEATFEDLRNRIGKCLAYLDSLTAHDFQATTPDTLIKLPRQPTRALRADDYLLSRQFPNFFFHVSTAYNLLRHGGVEIGKSDLVGTLSIVDVAQGDAKTS